MAGVQVAAAPQARISPTQPIIHDLMVSMDARHTGDLRFDSLLRHFFKTFNQHLALQGPPGGQTVRHHLPTSTKTDGQSGGRGNVGGENNHES